MRRERHQQPSKRSRQPSTSREQQEESTNNFSLGSLKIKEKHHEQKPVSSMACVLSVGVLLVVSTYGLSAFSVSLSQGKSTATSSVLPKLKPSFLRRSPMLPKPGEYAPLRPNSIIPLIQLRKAPTPEYHIFSVSSEQDMAFIVLTNILMGLFDKPDEHLGIVRWSTIGNQYLTRYKNEWMENNVTVVSHMLETDLTNLQREFRPLYRNMFLFVVDRGQPECQTPQEFIMICISQSHLMYHGIEDEKVVIGRIVQRMQSELPYF
jgi:hypothetical protein